jgi:hypothetical protein
VARPALGRVAPAAPVVALVVAVFAAGCQGKPQFTFAPVEGTVSKGGKPLSGVVVVFWGDNPDGSLVPCSCGPTNSSGHYELHTEQGQEGAALGRYRVCLLETSAVLSHMIVRKGADRLPKDLLTANPPEVPELYNRKESTPLHAEVRPGAQVVDIEVK